MTEDSHQSTLVKRVYNEQKFDRFERQVAVARLHMKLAIEAAPATFRNAYLNSMSTLVKLAIMQIGSSEQRIIALEKEIAPMVKDALLSERN